MIEITVDRVFSDEGSAVVFGGVADDRYLRFVANYPPAQVILDALATGEHPVWVIEPSQIVGWGMT